MLPLRPSSRAPARRPRRVRWFRSVALLALAAFVLPSLGVLPWIAADLARDAAVARVDHAGQAPHAHHPPHGHAHALPDASDIPGSPLHPEDHHCSPCQVLAHLARCAFLPPPCTSVAALAPSPVQPLAIAAQPIVAAVVALPPARAPPPSLA